MNRGYVKRVASVNDAPVVIVPGVKVPGVTVPAVKAPGLTATAFNLATALSIAVKATLAATLILPATLTVADEIGPILILAPSQSSQVPFEVGDTAAGEFTGFHEVLEKEQLQKSGNSLAEVIATESGVQFRQSGGSGSFSTVSLRGSSAEQVNVYLDGVLLNEASGGGVNLSDIELMQAEKVEVYRGTVPVQLGNSAIGGAVNITTARLNGAPVSSLLAGFGSFGTARFSSAYSGRLGWFDNQHLVASFSHRQSDNDFPFLNDNGTSFNTADDEVQRRNNGQTRSTSGFLKTGHTLGNNRQIEYALQAQDARRGIADWRNTTSGTATLDTSNVQWRTTIKRSAQAAVSVDETESNTNTAASGWSSLYGFEFSQKHELFDDRESSIGTGRQLVDSATRVFGGRAYWEKINQHSSVAINIRARREALESVNKLISGNTTNAVRLRSDTSVQFNRYFGSDNSLLSATLFAFSINDTYDINNNENARENFSTSTLLPQLGLSHVINDQWTLISNASQHKRAPSFFELFGSQGLFEGNSSLQTETSNNFDIGLRWRSDPGNDIDASVELAGFYNRRQNLITRVYNARGIGRSVNLAKASVGGIEFNPQVAFGNGIALSANLTLQDSENLSSISGFTGKQLPGESRLDGSVKATWKKHKWKLEYEYRFNSDRFYDSANLLPAADQRIHNVSVQRSWKDWRLDVELNNLTDHNYEDFNGYAKPGRAAFISIFYKPQPETIR